jgi:cation transport ATPase
MVGDGINDAPAITTGMESSSFVSYAHKSADVGIAMGSGSDITISNAEFVLIYVVESNVDLDSNRLIPDRHETN